MRILITGGCGFIGAWTAQLCLREGHGVVSLDLSTDSEIAREILGADTARVEWRAGSVTQYEDVLAAARSCDVLVNLAGLLTPDCQRDPLAGAQVNLIGALNVFEAAKALGLRRVVYSSSVSVFGPDDPATPFPTTHYGAFKLAVEGCARAYWDDHAISSIGIRPGIVFGPGRKTGLTAGLTEACQAAIEGRRFEIGFTGEVPIVHVEDIARSFVAAALVPADGAHVCNLVSDVVTVEHFIEELRQIVPAADIGCIGPTVPFITNGRVDPVADCLPNFAYTALGDGLRKTVRYFGDS